MPRKREGVEVTYQFEHCTGATASAPLEWMRLAGWLFRFAPVGIGATPVADAAGALSALLRTSPTRTPQAAGAGVDSTAGVRLRSIILPDGSKLVRSYDIGGQLVEVSYPDGQVVRYRGGGSTITVLPGIPARIVYSRDPSGQPRSIDYTCPSGDTDVFMYDWYPNGLLKRISYPDGVTVQYRWDTNGCLEAVTDGLSTISYVWSGSRRLLRVVCSDGKRSLDLDLSVPDTVVIWQASDQKKSTQLISPLGIHGYDSSGRVSSLLRLDGNRIAFSYDSSGKIVCIHTGAGATFIARTPSGDFASLVQPHGARFCWCVGTQPGAILVVGDASIARAECDSRSRLVELRDAAGSFVKYDYGRSDPGDCPRYITSSRWGKVELQYGPGERLKRVAWAGKGRCDFSYGPQGHLTDLRLKTARAHLFEIANLADWYFALRNVGPATLADSLKWSHLIR